MLLVLSNANAQSTFQWKTGNSGGYAYRYVTNDPTKSRFYTLKNGLTVILSQNNKEPQITFKMAVRAGSNSDPKTNTGLAHYLEHLLFKGTDKFGTLDYAKEKPLLDKIQGLYETYGKTTDPETRKQIYKEIDRVSGEASKYAIANEYDKMMKSIGSTVTNAHTAVEETVYEENLPSNALDKFLAVQAERFRAPVFRLFHTELEAVYEEKNMGMDNARRKTYEVLLKTLFPTHNYGQQTTIGTIEHLKNPSMVEIRNYYNKFYVPNNMAVIMAGDLNFDEAVKKIDKSFTYMTAKPLSEYKPAPEKPLTTVQRVDVYDPSAENLMVAYRGFASNTRESLLLDMIAKILSNGKAGLMDINVNKQQKMLNSGAGYNQMKDYGMFIMSGSPKSGQSLEDAEQLFLQQINLLKAGKFDERLIKATVANIKLEDLNAFESNDARAQAIMNAFIQNRGTQWRKILASNDEMEKVSKKEIVDFANRFFLDNYAVIFKRKGVDKNILKVDKPAITAIQTNRNEISPFTKNIISAPVKPITPKFLDYTKDLSFGKSGIADVLYVQNKDNGIFRMTYRFDKGSYNYKLLPYAAQYLSFLGDDKKTAEEISREFYELACTYSLNVGTEVTSLTLSGLDQNFDRAVVLLEKILTNCKADEKALDAFKSRILKNMDNQKLNKSMIMNGLTSFAQFGADNPFRYSLSVSEVKNIKSADLIDLLHNLTNYKHSIVYYGPKTLATLQSDIVKIHPLPSEFTPEAPFKTFTYAKTDSTKVYFADYDMVQADIRWVRNGGLYDPQKLAGISLFNNYFGGGMGSVVFQTIRESKALAYSTFATYQVPASRTRETAMIAYVGAQADKMLEAVSGMNELISVIPEASKSFALAKTSAENSIQTQRITQDDIIYSYLADKKLGFNEDSRISRYNQLKALEFTDIRQFHSENIAGKSYIYCIVSSEKKINLQGLEKLGPVTKLSLEQIFGY